SAAAESRLICSCAAALACSKRAQRRSIMASSNASLVGKLYKSPPLLTPALAATASRVRRDAPSLDTTVSAASRIASREFALADTVTPYHTAHRKYTGRTDGIIPTKGGSDVEQPSHQIALRCCANTETIGEMNTVALLTRTSERSPLILPSGR